MGALFTFLSHSLSLLVLSRTRSLTILSPYSSYCACGHSPWVFALPGLILLLPVISFCLLLIDASCAAALLSFVLGQRLLLTLSFSLQCRLLAFLSLHFQICSPLFIFLLSPACTQIYPLTPPPLLEIAPHTPVCVLLSKSLGSSSTIVWFVGPSQLRFGFLPWPVT